MQPYGRAGEAAVEGDGFAFGRPGDGFAQGQARAVGAVGREGGADCFGIGICGDHDVGGEVALDRTDVEAALGAGIASGVEGKQLSGVAVAVEVEGVDGAKAGVASADQRTAGEDGVGLHRATIIGEGGETRIAAAVDVAALIGVDKDRGADKAVVGGDRRVGATLRDVRGPVAGDH